MSALKNKEWIAYVISTFAEKPIFFFLEKRKE